MANQYDHKKEKDEREKVHKFMNDDQKEQTIELSDQRSSGGKSASNEGHANLMNKMDFFNVRDTDDANTARTRQKPFAIKVFIFPALFLCSDIWIHKGSGLTEEKPNPNSCDEPSDGGYGWFVVLGAFMVQVTSFGVITSWGTILK